MNKDFNNDRVMHIDTSSKLYERKDTGIVYKIIKSNRHKGLGLSLKLKKELERDLDANFDYARIYAICIYYLVKNDLDLFDTLIICGNENINLVKDYLRVLFFDNKDYQKKEIKSIYELRKITGNKGLKSYADNIASSYRKRVLKSVQRQQTGISLNPIKVNYKMICNKWKEIEEKMKRI